MARYSLWVHLRGWQRPLGDDDWIEVRDWHAGETIAELSGAIIEALIGHYLDHFAVERMVGRALVAEPKQAPRLAIKRPVSRVRDRLYDPARLAALKARRRRRKSLSAPE